MEKTALAIKINKEIVNRARRFCDERGIKYGFFIEKAIEARLREEELKEDILDLKRLRHDENRAESFEEYMKMRDA